MSPSHAARDGKRYRYYITRSAAGTETTTQRIRVPAGDLETLVIRRLARFLGDPAAIDAHLPRQDAEALSATLDHWRSVGADLETMLPTEQRSLMIALGLRVQVHRDRIDLRINATALAEGSHARKYTKLDNYTDHENRISLSIPASLTFRGPDLRFAVPPTERINHTRRDPTLIKLIVTAHAAREMLMTSKATPLVADYSREHLTRLARLGFLAPDIVTAILEGHQPVDLISRRLLRATHIPLAWAEQRKVLGFV